MLETLVGGLLRGAYLVPVVVGCLLVARHGSYLPLWLPQSGLVSAYTAYFLAERSALPVLVAAVLSVLAGTGFGVVVHLVFFQRCIETREPYRALVSGLAVITLVTSTCGLLTAGYPVSFHRARGVWKAYVGWPVADTIRSPDLVALVSALAILTGVAWFVGRTRIGLEYRALSSNRGLACDYGLRTTLLDHAIPMGGALLCAFGGLVYALKFGAQPSFMVPVSIKAIAVVVALGSIGGVLLAGFATLALAMGESAVQASPSVSVFEHGLAYAVLVVALMVQHLLGPRFSRWIWQRRSAWPRG